MEFNLKNTPLELKDILDERKLYSDKISKFKKIQKHLVWVSSLYLVTLFAIIIAGAWILANLQNQKIADLFLYTFIGGVLLAMAAVPLYHYLIENPLLNVIKKHDKVSFIEQDLCPDIIEWCQSYDIISTYQDSVSKQGRMLVNGEYSAMKYLIVNEQNKLLEEKEAAACEKLSKWNASPKTA